jgi:hypothetical protein
MMRPLSAHALLRWTARTFGDDAAIRVFEPLIADWQQDRRTAGSRTARALAWLRGGVALLCCLAAVGVSHALPRAEDWPRIVRSAAVALAFLLLGTLVLLVPFLPWWFDRGWVFGHVAIDLLPTTLGFAWPLALVPAAVRLGARSRDADLAWRARTIVILAAAGTTAALTLVDAVVAPVAARDFQQRVRRSLPTVPEALNAPAARLAALSATTGVLPRSSNERRRHAAMSLLWPAALLVLGWRAGRSLARDGVAALATWWLLPAGIALAFQPAATPFGSLHPMQFFETPEFSAAAVWLAIAMALRPRGDHAGVRAA